MNNLLSYCGLVYAKIRASDKDLPVSTGQKDSFWNFLFTFVGCWNRVGRNMLKKFAFSDFLKMRLAFFGQDATNSLFL